MLQLSPNVILKFPLTPSSYNDFDSKIYSNPNGDSYVRVGDGIVGDVLTYTSTEFVKI